MLLLIVRVLFGHGQKIKLKDLTLFKKSDLASVIINNSYFQKGSKSLRQVTGIPMESDPTPFFANLYLVLLQI